MHRHVSLGFLQMVVLGGLLSAAGCSNSESSDNAAAGGAGGSPSDASADVSEEPAVDADAAVEATSDDVLEAGAEVEPDAEEEADAPEADGGCLPMGCVQLGANCGTAPDGCGATVSCGTCPAGQTCGGNGPNQCGTAECFPRQCTQLGASCGVVSDGCEGVLDCGECTAPETCGGGGLPLQCGCTCVLPNAVTTCSGQSGCLLQSCEEGFRDCNGLANDGCEAVIASDPANCGACGTICSFGHAAAKCEQGICVMADCDPGHADCNADPSDGCEINTQTNPLHCGGCDLECPDSGGIPLCQGGMCKINPCGSGLGNCDGDDKNGCETDVTSSTSNCGACGNLCALTHADPACVLSSCRVASCKAGFGNCDGQHSNGCEASFLNSPTSCGGCDHFCVEPTGSTATCVNGSCSFICDKYRGNCDESAKNGCEAFLDSDVLNCGECDRVCAYPNAAPGCTNGSCVLSSCNSGYADCDKFWGDGCETNISTSPSNCGACGVTCSGVNMTTVGCVLGKCVGSCLKFFANCNGNLQSDGCETYTQTDVNNCGGCGTKCITNATCESGACTCAKPCGSLCCSASQKCCNGTHCIPQTQICDMR